MSVGCVRIDEERTDEEMTENVIMRLAYIAMHPDNEHLMPYLMQHVLTHEFIKCVLICHFEKYHFEILN